MDLSQDKLTKSEWQSIEIPVSEQEKTILQLIIDGYKNTNIRHNTNLSIYSFLKIDLTEKEKMDAYIYQQFFKTVVDKIHEPLSKQPALQWTQPLIPQLPQQKKMQIKSADKIRIENMKKNIEQNRPLIFEFLLIEFIQKIVGVLTSTKPENKYEFYVYTLIQFRKSSILHINDYISKWVYGWVEKLTAKTQCHSILYNAVDYVEKNQYLLKYADLMLFSHQKDLFDTFNHLKINLSRPRLVLYIAPTGTGKTLSPLGLANDALKVIFVCSARHVGLSLAKSAISAEKRVAFAYGCNTDEDIRLHNFAAVDYMKNRRTGGICKVDNSNGSRVDIMICDVKSYLIAMEYMLRFHGEESLILYWDEPTITMDYEDHPLHPIIHNNWTKNRISKIVLSCATLPKPEEIQTTIEHFLLTFTGNNANQTQYVSSIISYDCKKSISLIDTQLNCALPHNLFSEYRDLLTSVEHCLNNKTLLRYFDLGEVVSFLKHVIYPEDIQAQFNADISNITMTSIKLFYLKVLEEMDETKWTGYFTFLKENQKPHFKTLMATDNFRKSTSLNSSFQPQTNTKNNLHDTPLKRMQSVAEVSVQHQPADPYYGIQLTTKDAHTLTDGPTLYIAENVEQISMFYIHQTPIPQQEIAQIMQKIHSNEILQKKIDQVENEIEDHLGKEALKDKKMEKEHYSREVKNLKQTLEQLKEQFEKVVMQRSCVPNTEEHQAKWCGKERVKNAFVPTISEDDVIKIMTLPITESQKILLLLGIGVFVLNSPVGYLETIKQLAAEQKLFMIIASSDYIYGTNYPFCHGIIGKDLTGMTQQKTIQALGRMGRNKIQQDYTVRFRNADILKNLFLPQKRNLEAENICRLFSSS